MESYLYSLLFDSSLVTFNYQVEILSPLAQRRFHHARVGPVVRLLYFCDRELKDLAGLVQLVTILL